MSKPVETADLLLQHAEFLRRLAGSLVRDSARANDLVQETWLAALRRPAATIERPRAWLARVMRRLAGRGSREEARRSAREQAVARHEAAAPATEAIERDEMLRAVLDGVLGLDEPYRAAILARFYEGRRPREIARDLGLPVSTVNSRLQRGQAALRQRLERRFGDGSRLRAGLVALWLGREPGVVAASTAAAIGTTSGVLTMGLKTKVAACGLAVAVGALLLVERFGEAERPAGGAAPAESASAELAEPPSVDSADEPAVVSVPVLQPERVPVAAEPESSPATTGALVVRLRRQRTGEPAADRHVLLFPAEGFEPFRRQRPLKTDAAGEARCEGLAAGPWIAYVDLGGGGRAEVVAGETRTVDLTLPPGFHVEGRVRDADGRGVPGASVWLSDYGNEVHGRVVATTDEWGEFWIEDVGPGRSIGAHAEGHGPSTLQSIEGADDEVVELTLDLGRESATLEATVVDGDGTPIAGVTVEATRPDAWGEGTALAPRRATTDDAGRVRFAGLHTGPLAVAFRGPGAAPVGRDLVLEEGATESLQVVLEPAARLAGTVRDEEGTPVVGAEVQHGGYGDLLGSYARTDAEGRYRLNELPVGEVRVEVTHERGSALFEASLASGQERVWDPVLDAGRIVYGQVVDEAGTPMVDLEINLLSLRPRQGTRSLWSQRVTTRADGAFEFAGCPAGELRLDVKIPYPDAATLAIRNVAEGEEEQHIVIADADLPSASVTGTVVDPSGVALGAEVRLFGPRGSYRQNVTRGGIGRFTFRALSPGEYGLEILAPGFPHTLAPRFTLEVDEDRDLGEIDLTPPGFVTVVARGHEGPGPFTSIRLGPLDRASGARSYAPAPDELERFPVLPTRYRVIGHGPTAALTSVEVSVAAGEEARVVLEVRSGQPCEFVWTEVADLDQLGWLSFTLQDEAGQRLHGAPLSLSGGATPRAELRLEPGRYAIETVASDGRRERTSFEVTAGRELRLELGL